MMKRLMALLMALCMLVTGMAFAEEDEEYSLGDVVGEDTLTTPEPEEEDEDSDVYFDEDTEALLDDLQMDVELDTENVIDPASLELNPNLPDNVVNILLIGVDGRTDDIKTGSMHGDVQIIVSINKNDGSIKMTSVMRDLYVTIPGYKSKNRINVAYARGQGPLAMRTMNRLLELNIEHYVVINFYGLASIIDSLGGIDIELTKKEATAINSYIRKNLAKSNYDNQSGDYVRQELAKVDGVQHLDGIQAVMYARLRSIDNDFERTSRQRHLMELLLGKVLNDGMSTDKLIGLMEVCLPYALTNMTVWDIVELATAVLSSDILSRIKSGEQLLDQERIPMDETWKYYTTEGGASVVAFRSDARREQNVQALHEFIYGAYYPAETK